MKAYPLFFHDSFQFQTKIVNRKGLLNIKERNVIVTTCVLLDDSRKVLSIGVAVQNFNDSYNRKTGNKIALSRAVSSFRVKRNIYPVKRDYTIVQISKTFPELLIQNMFKGMFNPTEESLNRFKFLIEKKKLTDKCSIDV